MKKQIFTRKDMREFAAWMLPSSPDFYVADKDITTFLKGRREVKKKWKHVK